MSDSDDELICVSDNPSKGKWPTEQEIDEITERMVTDHVERGLSASELPLKEVLKRFNNCGYSGNFMNSPEYIRLICKQLRKHQKIAANTLAQVQYYKGNISSIDVATLNPGEWLNDTIMNRYMELITQRYPNFVAISSFYTEAFLSSSNMKGEKLPPMEGKIGLLPLNVNAHWTLAMISVRHKTIVLFDSMGNTYDLDALYVLNKLRIQLNEIYQVNFTVRQHQKVKSQTNSDDCGPFVLLFAREFAEGADYITLLGSRHMKGLRAFFKEEIMDGKLRDWSSFIASRKDIKTSIVPNS